jgi:hypothetical protein
VRQGERRPAPPQSVRREVEVAHHRRRHAEGIEGTEDVVYEARVGQLGAAHRPTRLGLGFEHHDAPTGIGKQVGRHQAVGPGADHHRVDLVHREDRTGRGAARRDRRRPRDKVCTGN